MAAPPKKRNAAGTKAAPRGGDLVSPKCSRKETSYKPIHPGFPDILGCVGNENGLHLFLTRSRVVCVPQSHLRSVVATFDVCLPRGQETP